MDPEPIEFEDELERVIRAEPFVPFTLVTASGDRYIVSFSNWIYSGRDVVVVLRPNIGFVKIRSYNIVAIEMYDLQ